MREKIIVFSLALNLSLLIYILEIPNRVSLMPGGELFIVPFVGLIWLVGHEVQKEIRQDRKEGRR